VHEREASSDTQEVRKGLTALPLLSLEATAAQKGLFSKIPVQSAHTRNTHSRAGAGLCHREIPQPRSTLGQESAIRVFPLREMYSISQNRGQSIEYRQLWYLVLDSPGFRPQASPKTGSCKISEVIVQNADSCLEKCAAR
jgi:hypothetical protein